MPLEHAIPPTECPCRRTGCERHGDCAACIAYHASARHPAYCQRPTRGRRRRDRSGDNADLPEDGA